MEKIQLEFPLSCHSRTMIWDMIGTTGGLEAWMADKVTVADGTYTFSWGEHETRDAELLAQRLGTYVRFRWKDESPKTFFELRISHSDLTRNFTLVVTEQSDDDDVEGLKQVWESLAENLSRAGV